VINPWNVKKNQPLSATPLWRFAAQSLLGKAEPEAAKRRLFSLFTLRPDRNS
jgi:pilus assembly protein CpaE